MKNQIGTLSLSLKFLLSLRIDVAVRLFGRHGESESDAIGLFVGTIAVSDTAFVGACCPAASHYNRYRPHFLCRVLFCDYKDNEKSDKDDHYAAT